MISKEILAFLEGRVAANDFPSSVFLVAEKGEIVFHDALGHAVVKPEPVIASINTIYDMASLTKVLVTGLLIAKFIEDGRMSVDSQISGILSEFDTADKRALTVKHLLSHTSRLPAWKPLSQCVSQPSFVLNEIAVTELLADGPLVAYSDLNFIVLGKIIERVAGYPLDTVASELIFGPLGLTSTMYNPPPNLRPRIAASEMGNEYERAMCLEKGLASAETQDRFRKYQIWGEVHDGNAFFMGGVAGHAGLFSTAEEVFKIAQQFLPNYTTLLKPETCELFRTNFTPGLNEHRSFAFQLASTPDSTALTIIRCLLSS